MFGNMSACIKDLEISRKLKSNLYNKHLSNTYLKFSFIFRERERERDDKVWSDGGIIGRIRFGNGKNER